MKPECGEEADGLDLRNLRFRILEPTRDDTKLIGGSLLFFLKVSDSEARCDSKRPILRLATCDASLAAFRDFDLVVQFPSLFLRWSISSVG